MVASSAIAVAGIGVVYAGTASASPTPQQLCVATSSGQTVCAWAPDSGVGHPVKMEVYTGTDNVAPSKWYYPISETSTRTIAHNGSSDCMESSSNGNVLYEACDSSPNQEWFVYAFKSGTDPADGLMIENEENDQCLEYAAQAGILITDNCSPGNGQWFYPLNLPA